MIFNSNRFRGKYCESQIICSPGFYGDDCSTQCYATDTCLIHQACDYFGRLKCRDGWGNFPVCNIRLIDQSIDPECPVANSDLHPRIACLNGGSCWLGTCCCPPSYTGPRCEILINQCVSSPCLNLALCVPTQTSFSCVCNPGFSGIFCQSSINPCSNKNICSGSGQCVPYANFTSYYCTCFDGYTGRNCENSIDYCATLPCQNNASCISILNSFFCQCRPGFQYFFFHHW